MNITQVCMSSSRNLRVPLALALCVGVSVPTAQATLQVYEGFDYTVGQSLNTQNGGTGFAAGSAWVAGNTGGSAPYLSPMGFAICDALTQTLWNGTVISVPQTGKYSGSTEPVANPTSGFNGNKTGDEWATRPMDPSVTATFSLGAVTWMSYVEASNFKANGNGTGGSFAIAQGNLGSATGSNRGWTAYGGSAIGIGVDSAKRFRAAFWDASLGTGGVNLTGTQGASWLTSGAPQISIAKITWGDASTPTTIQEATFNDGTVLTEAAFNAAAVSFSTTFDPSTFVNVALGGARYNVDELRIGTTFDDAIGVVAVSAGKYWAPAVGGGGAGNWGATSNVWASVPLTQGTLAQSSTESLLFSGAAGMVTIDGTVTASVGIEFATSLYSLVPGASTPNLSLAGINAAANTLTVLTGTNTISAPVAGSAGMTKAGSGTLVLSGINTYAGGTMLNAGTLQIAGITSLGSGTVTFGGGTLQYPVGSGASLVDVSIRIPTIATNQLAKIDTDGYNVTFASAMGGEGGLIKLGSGSLTLAAANTFSGPTTVSAGTLNISGLSGTLATLNVPVGGTANLAANTAARVLNIMGGATVLSGAGVQANMLVATAGTLDASADSLAVATSAALGGITFTRTSGTPMTFKGTNLIAATSLGQMTVTASGGTLDIIAMGRAVAIGKGAPGISALPATASFSGSGVWSINGGLVQSFGNNVYGFDNHSFQYIAVPSEDFDLVVHVTSAVNGRFGLMARNMLVSAYDAPSGNNAVAIWNGASAMITNGVMFSTGLSTPSNPWLKITRVGTVVTTYSSNDGITYNQEQQVDFTDNPWGPTTYLGLDLTDTSGLPSGVSGTFDNVNFMGTATLPALAATDLVLANGAKLTLGGGITTVHTMMMGSLGALEGTWGSSASPAQYKNDTYFNGSGVVSVTTSLLTGWGTVIHLR